MKELTLYYYGYNPIGDILVLANVIILLVLIQIVYTRPKDELKVLKGILFCVALAATVNLFRFEFSVHYVNTPIIALYALRSLYHLLLFVSLYLYLKYIEKLLKLNKKREKFILRLAFICVIFFWLADIIATVTKVGFYYSDDNLNVHPGKNILFATEYIILVGLIIFMIIKYSERIYRPLVAACFATTMVSVGIMVIQGFYNQRSFTTSTFVFPAIAVLYILHSNPFDPELGILHIDALDEMIEAAGKKKTELVILSYYLHEYDQPGKKYPEDIKTKIRYYITSYLKGASLFQISTGRMLLIAEKAQNPDYKKVVEKMMEIFQDNYDQYHQDFKIVLTKSVEELKTSEDYIRIFEFLESRMNENEIRTMTEEDLEKFKTHKYIVDQLEDINLKRNLLDQRVTVFCQPILNTRTGKFDTAEALMRLTLEETGMVFPDVFIPIAEKHNYIHGLSMIILSKTCQQIKELMEQGYDFKRISVNFSILDVREHDFCESIKSIVEERGIPFEKLGIEITESQNESDFKTIKEKFAELKAMGITLYLDDFGTGYSSFERIVEIPFDTIKFDRSMVIASAKDVKAETMVSYLAHMFTDLNYSVLFEGIEDENDESRCNAMFARYLQGYKYSKAIPIGRLTEFFEKKDNPA